MLSNWLVCWRTCPSIKTSFHRYPTLQKHPTLNSACVINGLKGSLARNNQPMRRSHDQMAPGCAETLEYISNTSVSFQLAFLGLLWALCLGRCLVLGEWQHQVFQGCPADQLPSACPPPAAFVIH